jgi:hypothetical protein
MDRIYSFDGQSLTASPPLSASFSRWWSVVDGQIISPDLKGASFWQDRTQATDLGFSPEGWTAAASLGSALLAVGKVYEANKGFAYRLYPDGQNSAEFFEGTTGLFVSDMARNQNSFIVAGSTWDNTSFELWSFNTLDGTKKQLASLPRQSGFLRVLLGDVLYCYESAAQKEGPTTEPVLYMVQDGQVRPISLIDSPIERFYGSGFALPSSKLLLPGIGKDGTAILALAQVSANQAVFTKTFPLPAPAYQALSINGNSAFLICYDHFQAPGLFQLVRIELD